MRLVVFECVDAYPAAMMAILAPPEAVAGVYAARLWGAPQRDLHVVAVAAVVAVLVHSLLRAQSPRQY